MPLLIQRAIVDSVQHGFLLRGAAALVLGPSKSTCGTAEMEDTTRFSVAIALGSDTPTTNLPPHIIRHGHFRWQVYLNERAMVTPRPAFRRASTNGVDMLPAW